MQHVHDAAYKRQISHNTSTAAWMQESTLPGKLTNICDAMASNGSICQGFVYNSFTGTAFFKGNATDTQIDTSQLCLSPNSTAWLLSSGKQAWTLKQLVQTQR